VAKRAGEVAIPLSVDWADVLASGETIDGTPAWTVVDAAATDSSPLAVAGSDSLSSTTASNSFSAGTKGQVYRARCTMVTSGGATHVRDWSVRIIA